LTARALAKQEGIFVGFIGRSALGRFAGGRRKENEGKLIVSFFPIPANAT